MRVIANFAVVRGDDNKMFTLSDEFDVSEERGKELIKLGAVTRLDEPDKAVVVKRGPGRPRKNAA